MTDGYIVAIEPHKWLWAEAWSVAIGLWMENIIKRN